jgi:hypothetical protein
MNTDAEFITQILKLRSRSTTTRLNRIFQKADPHEKKRCGEGAHRQWCRFRMGRKLPLELYRTVCEFSRRDELLNIAVVSRALQAEAERVIWWKLRLAGGLGKGGSLDKAQRFLDTPRFHLYVQCLDIYYYLEPHDPMPITLVTLLERLSNLLALNLEVYREVDEDNEDEDSHMVIRCRNIFQNCSFRLHFLSCPFILDADMRAFLQRQPSIAQWRRIRMDTPPTDECDYLSPDILPNLTVFCESKIFSALDIEIHKGRFITHVSLETGVYDFSGLAGLARVAPHLRSLFTGYGAEALEALPDLFPDLECLSRIDYEINEVRYVYPALEHTKSERILLGTFFLIADTTSP